MTIKEVHGVAYTGKTTDYHVTVVDGFGCVRLQFDPPTIAITPDEARFLAGCLTASADRVDSAIADTKEKDQ